MARAPKGRANGEGEGEGAVHTAVHPKWRGQGPARSQKRWGPPLAIRPPPSCTMRTGARPRPRDATVLGRNGTWAQCHFRRNVTSGASRLQMRLIERAHPHGTEVRANDILGAELDDGHGQRLRSDQMQDRAEAGSLIEIALAHVAIDDHQAILAHAGEKGLNLRGRRG